VGPQPAEMIPDFFLCRLVTRIGTVTSLRLAVICVATAGIELVSMSSQEATRRCTGKA
jgi:hypothetical protein